ncbi:DUF4192 family protein [Streptomyces pseudogriseolus]|uniref:DUF4192 family protein n=1 Tax=Streptomyces pseudogriseolus TaxID=36817 RepID=UPI003FA204CB
MAPSTARTPETSVPLPARTATTAWRTPSTPSRWPASTAPSPTARRTATAKPSTPPPSTTPRRPAPTADSSSRATGRSTSSAEPWPTSATAPHSSWTRSPPGSGRVRGGRRARITLGLQDPETRDVALSTGDENDLPAERQLWGYLARRCVPPHTDKAPPLLTLLGWVAWRQNDTVTASHAFSDALDIDPHYRLAKHMLEGIRTECDRDGFLEIFRAADQRFAADRADLDNL